MAIVLNANIECRAPYPIDTRYKFATIEARDALSPYVLYTGLICYVESTTNVYVYKGGGAGWIEIGNNNDINWGDIQDHIADDDIHVTAAQKAALDASVNPGADNRYLTLGDLNSRGITTIVDTTTEMVALTGSVEGDRAVVVANVADPSKNGEWIAIQNSPTTIAHWLLLPNQSAVTSVAGRTGNVSLYKADILDLTDTTVDGVTHENGYESAIPNGAQWIYDSADGKMKLGLSGGGVLSSAITATVALGGIPNGTIFPIGTSLETILAQLLQPADIYNFTFNGYTSVREVGTTASVTSFTWSVAGTPASLTLSDSKSVMGNVSVTGTSYSPAAALNYNYSTFTSCTWTLAGTNVANETKTMYWVNPSYWGLFPASSSRPDAVTVLGGTKLVMRTDSSASFNISNPNSENFWIAVEAGQSPVYTNWDLAGINSAEIGGSSSSSFIKYLGELTVSGKQYDIYVSGYNSKVDTTLILS